MRVHFIAIGGSAMHNLALALHKKGFAVTGSDDEILEPSKSRLQKAGLLPAAIGWFPEKLDAGIDAVILGMHARNDNEELIRAKELGLKIFSYPEYIYEQTKDKTRVVIGGSHGKTTITSMILHVLNYHKKKFDYMVGAQLEGFETMVQLSQEAPCAIIEGDEYLSSPIDRRPKFHLYKPHIAVLSGIAWDHINVFPTFENYLEQFSIFINMIIQNGTLYYSEDDVHLAEMVKHHGHNIKKIPYTFPEHSIREGKTLIHFENEEWPVKVFGEHNLMNLQAAWHVCRELEISDKDFLVAVRSFKGASKRLECVIEKEDFIMYKDFAHSPSKLKATTSAVKKQYPGKKLIACMELHTFSSLNENFLDEYNDSMKLADEAIVYFNPHTIAHKKLKPITEQQVKKAFGSSNVAVFTDSRKVREYLESKQWSNHILLMMSSGNFDGIDFNELGAKLSVG